MQDPCLNWHKSERQQAICHVDPSETELLPQHSSEDGMLLIRISGGCGNPLYQFRTSGNQTVMEAITMFVVAVHTPSHITVTDGTQ